MEAGIRSVDNPGEGGPWSADLGAAGDGEGLDAIGEEDNQKKSKKYQSLRRGGKRSGRRERQGGRHSRHKY